MMMKGLNGNNVTKILKIRVGGTFVSRCMWSYFGKKKINTNAIIKQDIALGDVDNDLS